VEVDGHGYARLIEHQVDLKFPPEEAKAIKAAHRFDSWSIGNLAAMAIELKAMPNFDTPASRELDHEAFYGHHGKIFQATCPFPDESKRANLRVLGEDGGFQICIGYLRFMGPEKKLGTEEVRRAVG
jgi:hypothetical protein